MKNRDILGTFLLAVLLFLVVGLTDSAGAARVLIAVPLVLFLPGHVLIRLVGPIRVSFLEHTMYAFGVSIALCVAGGFLLNALSLLTPHGWAGWFVVLTGLMLLTAILRRCEPMALVVTWPRVQRWQLVVFALSLAITTGAYGLALHDEAVQKEFKYTEFWLLSKPNSDTLTLGINSAEDQTESFDIEVTTDGVLFARWSSVEAVPGEPLVRQFNVGSAKRVEARLYRSNDHTLYRNVSAVLSRKDSR